MPIFRKVIIWTLVFIFVYMLLRRSGRLEAMLKGGTSFFSEIWGALVK